MFLRNHWYAAGFPDEIGRTLLARTLLGEDVLFYRRADGAPVALENRCAHRRLPLSMGALVGDAVQCGYHGLEYDHTGACIKIPGQHGAPNVRLRAYPLVERHRYLWIWMGDPALADPSLIPDFSRLDAPDVGVTRIQLKPDCHVQLVIDNLLDLSHLAYVHNTTTGNAALAEDAEVRTERRGDVVQVKRWVRNVVPAPTFVQFGGYNGRVNLWQVSEFRPPSYVRVSYGSAPADHPMPDGDDIWSHGHWGFAVFHGLTPETDRTTHQFRHVAHDRGLGDAQVTAEFYRQCDQIIREDLAIFAVQQRALDAEAGDAPPSAVNARVAIHADGGLLQARLINERLMREQARL
ncbi:MAG TPA: aromatic ring-hydroxylating dioxygenase subunit alpha [Candidatus Sulfotelmatobacter sp.]|nr:aromatic ring-hydroxylating dioxygenase subunit alpha [Candidatus Sulfotelmatobacter sp.]